MANAHAKPHHDYHLVNPSPWPAVGATSAFVAAVGAILWMHQMVPYAPLVLGAGAIGIAYTMVGWWRDVIHEAELPIPATGSQYSSCSWPVLSWSAQR